MKFLNTKNAFTYLALVAVMLMPELAAADNPIGETLCAVVEWFTGPVGGGIATLAIIIIGIGALMGKVSWGMAIIVGLGVAIIFGAEQFITALGTDGSAC